MTTTPKATVTVTLTIDAAKAIERMTDQQMATHSNWIESALVHGDTERAIRLAKERKALRETVFSVIRGGLHDSLGTWDR